MKHKWLSDLWAMKAGWESYPTCEQWKPAGSHYPTCEQWKPAGSLMWSVSNESRLGVITCILPVSNESRLGVILRSVGNESRLGVIIRPVSNESRLGVIIRPVSNESRSGVIIWPVRHESQLTLVTMNLMQIEKMPWRILINLDHNPLDSQPALGGTFY